MKNGATYDYDYSRKRHWRRWNWNRICERLAVRPRDAVVLYLAGSSDLDRPIALERGFKESNLIAVDRESAVVRELRNSGVITIKGDILDCLVNWPTRHPLHVVLADFCCAPTCSLVEKICLCESVPSVHRAVFSINFMRGRDPDWTSFHRKIEAYVPAAGEVFGELYGRNDLKSRSRQFFIFRYCALAQGLASIASFPGAALSDEEERQAAVLLVHALVSMRFAFSGYQNRSGIVFDGVVYCGAGQLLDEPPQMPPGLSASKSQGLASKIIANLAVRTRRINSQP